MSFCNVNDTSFSSPAIPHADGMQLQVVPMSCGSASSKAARRTQRVCLMAALGQLKAAPRVRASEPDQSEWMEQG